ncbi:MAG: DUF362 domain-containing protein [Desulfomonile sp.]|nr:DUF362 domain-containing protein [Desulfomonile sp.]
MTRYQVAVVRYEKPMESVRRAVNLCDGLAGLKVGDRVFIKPNIVFWTASVPFPKWGVITTSRVVADMVTILAERGITDITIGEGMVLFDPKDTKTALQAFEGLGYNELGRRYGVKCIDVHQRPFEKVDLGDGVVLSFNKDFLESDFVVDIPVMKTHAQTKVSLGIKNLKGLINMSSRKKCHAADLERDLDFMVAKLANPMPRSFTIIDGIYTAERGPGFDGKMHRTNCLVACRDVLAADMVAAKVLGYEPADVPHLVHAARLRSRTMDLSDVEVVGDGIDQFAFPHQYTFPYNEDSTLPIQLERMGIKGLSYPKYDNTICTYCSSLTGLILTSIAMAWKGEPWGNVEVLTGKRMVPTPGKKTILLGKCLWDMHKNHPDIQNMIPIKTCPPSPKAIVRALNDVGIEVSSHIFDHMDMAPGYFMRKYENKPEFEESLFKVE